MTDRKVLASIKRTATRWRTALAGGTALVVSELGARIGLPGVDGSVVHDFIHSNAGGLLGLYDLFAGGATSRGAFLAIGILPYLAARLFVRAAQSTSPRVAELSKTAAGRAKLTRWTRTITVGLTGIQSVGYATFLQSIPGAVAHPGAGFLVQTTLLLTGTSLLVSWVGELLFPVATDEHDAATMQAEALHLDTGTESSAAQRESVAGGTQQGLLPAGAFQPFTIEKDRIPETTAARNVRAQHDALHAPDVLPHSPVTGRKVD